MILKLPLSPKLSKKYVQKINKNSLPLACLQCQRPRFGSPTAMSPGLKVLVEFQSAYQFLFQVPIASAETIPKLGLPSYCLSDYCNISKTKSNCKRFFTLILLPIIATPDSRKIPRLHLTRLPGAETILSSPPAPPAYRSKLNFATFQGAIFASVTAPYDALVTVCAYFASTPRV